MAVNPISSIAETQFREIYLDTFQQMRMLGGTLKEIHGAVGDAYKWPKIGNIDMVDRGAFGSLITPSAVDHSQITTTFENKISALEVGRDEQTLINPNERVEFARIQAAASGRQLDQLQIDAMDTGATEVIVDGGTNMTLQKITEARKRLLQNNAIRPGAIPYFLVHADQLEAMLQIEQLTSADFVSMKNLMSGDIKSFMGFDWIIYGDSTAGGLPKTGDIRSTFAWTGESVGSVFRLDPTIDVEWSLLHLAWVSIAQFIQGTSVLQTEGVIKVNCDETA